MQVSHSCAEIKIDLPATGRLEPHTHPKKGGGRRLITAPTHPNTPPGAAGLALGLVQGLLPSLRELDVSANRLGPAGVVRIVSALYPARPPCPAPAAAAPTVAPTAAKTKARAKQAAAAAGAPLVDLSYNLLPEERGAVSHAALPQGVLL
jgi:hypothetical protein